ncbi:Arylamine N-acetyltransferase [Pseudocercospora fuligena]|uniref:Arylamine N-acetyltransferase n=1 Tax=Pseudocercospora fuligena TaxID=685502 RepID=A0A8H6VTH1_9PEZI|nr:Arylamine N-acetyltransferase [Pseudocercospora fuligena]
MAIPGVFSEAQLSNYLTYIGIGPGHPLYMQRYSGDAAKDIHLLTQLHIHMISTIPYENLSLHYNLTHTIQIKPQGTFQKTVGNARGRGGYCMENTIFYHHILRRLGFPSYLAPVRIRHRVDGVPQGDYSGWVHLVIIVMLSDGSKWSVDVGFGGDCATAPVPLVHDQPQVNLGNQEIRLWRDHIPMQLLRTPETKHWIYQYRNSKEQDWNSFYAFTEYEAMEPDFHNLNWYTGSHPESFQTFTAIIVKFLRRPKVRDPGDGAHAGDQEIYGKRMLVNGIIKENLGGKTSIVKDCKTEEERIAGLQEWFGMTFTEEEREGIKGWTTELRGDGMANSDEVWHVKRGKQYRHEYQKVQNTG